MNNFFLKIKKPLSYIKKRATHLYQKIIKIKEIKKYNIIDIENYSNTFVFAKGFDKDSVLIDVGCAEDADLSVEMIKRYALSCYGVDPTKKHFPALKELEVSLNNHFKHLPYAIGANNTELTFYESVDNQSGSLKNDHINVRNDHINQYQVQCVTIQKLIEMNNIHSVDYFKLDIEGAEYDLIEKLEQKDLANIKQLFIEFHHRHLPDYTINDTKKSVKKVESLGFESFTFDKRNYLFLNQKHL